MNRSALLIAVLVPAAVWVNWPTLRALWPKEPSNATAEALPGDEANEFEPPAAPLAEVGAPFQPILPTDTLPDPFVRSDDHQAAQAAATQRQILPQVSMILRGKSSVRAVIDGRAVTVGDRLEVGTVATIEARSVSVRTRDGGLVVLPLRAPTKDEPKTPEPADNPQPQKD